MSHTQNYLGGPEAKVGVFRIEQFPYGFQSLLCQPLHEIIQGSLVPGPGLIEREREVGLLVAPFVDGRAMNPVFASDGGNGFAGEESGEDLGLDGRKF